MRHLDRPLRLVGRPLYLPVRLRLRPFFKVRVQRHRPPNAPLPLTLVPVLLPPLPHVLERGGKLKYQQTDDEQQKFYKLHPPVAPLPVNQP